MPEEPYFVEVEVNGCPCCGSGKTWIIVGPDETSLGRSFLDQEEASDLADMLNTAYFQGKEDN